MRADFKKILYNLYLFRLTDLFISKEYAKQEMRCPVHLSIGQEAVSAALSMIYNVEDFCVSYHRSHAHYLSKGGSLNKMIAEIHGKETGCSKGLGGSMHLVDTKKNFFGSTAVVANSIPVGVGLALSKKIEKKNGKVFIFLGDGSTEEGVFYESVNFVALKKLPVIFICENNKYSVYTGLGQRQPVQRKIFKVVASMGIKSFKINKKNPFEIYLNLKKIFKLCNQDPVFIEIDNYRYIEHCGPNQDDNLNYRPLKEQNFWKKNDPILLAEEYLLKKKIVKGKFFISEKKKINKIIEKAFFKAKKAKYLNYKILKNFI